MDNRSTLLIASCLVVTLSSSLAHGQTVYPTGTTIWQSGATSDGYTLYPDPGGALHLIDMDGTEVKTWNSPFPGHSLFYPKPLDNGNVLVFSAIPSGQGAPLAKSLLELDSQDNIVWEYTLPQDVPDGVRWSFHHDSDRLPNGNTLILASQPVDVPSISPITLIDDLILEVTPAGSVVWQWETWKHFGEFAFPEEQQNLIRQKGGDWAHANAVNVVPPNNHTDPAFAAGNIIISYRSINTIAIIDKTTNLIVWRTGPVNQLTWGQHFPHMIPQGLPGAGNIIVFDNGSGTGYCNQNFAPGRSMVYEIDPSEWPNGHYEVWTYGQGPAFSSDFISGATRLPNGNTLICSGVKGRLFEVDVAGTIVWEYMSPFGNRTVYRAYRVDYSWLQGP